MTGVLRHVESGTADTHAYSGPRKGMQEHEGHYCEGQSIVKRWK